MDFSKLLPVILKGIGAVQTLVNTGQNAGPAYRAVRVLLKKAEAGTVTEADLAETETDLDGLIDRFNRPI
ncbi:hypothetical protein [Bradyrhizobium sp.]|uniref:hypothetical protein n=1 Tax=Bradyrhizobium sp. TaxID=376 RepID=UPI0025C381A5|nr:hypothetical protein [Bradyrhizobium sp.]